MRRLVLFAGVATFIVIVGLFFSSGGQAQAGTGAVRGASSQVSSPTLGATDTLTLPYRIHLPFARRDVLPHVQMPEGEYLFVEYWTHSVLGAGCAGLCIDFPTYHFDPQSGELTIHTPSPPDPALVLGEGDIGYVGRGTSLGGAGCGIGSSLTKVQQCPMCAGGMTLHYVDETGTVTVEREDELIVLEPYGVWSSGEEIETWDSLGAGCIVTSTHYIANYGFQDQDEIIYSPLGALP